MQNGSSDGICTYTLHTRSCTFGAHLYVQSVLPNKIYASDLSMKFTKSVLLVGWAVKSPCLLKGLEAFIFAKEQQQKGEF